MFDDSISRFSAIPIEQTTNKNYQGKNIRNKKKKQEYKHRLRRKRTSRIKSRFLSIRISIREMKPSMMLKLLLPALTISAIAIAAQLQTRKPYDNEDFMRMDSNSTATVK